MFLLESVDMLASLGRYQLTKAILWSYLDKNNSGGALVCFMVVLFVAWKNLDHFFGWPLYGVVSYSLMSLLKSIISSLFQLLVLVMCHLFEENCLPKLAFFTFLVRHPCMIDFWFGIGNEYRVMGLWLLSHRRGLGWCRCATQLRNVEI
jgi:hypothetical protein